MNNAIQLLLGFLVLGWGAYLLFGTSGVGAVLVLFGLLQIFGVGVQVNRKEKP